MNEPAKDEVLAELEAMAVSQYFAKADSQLESLPKKVQCE